MPQNVWWKTNWFITKYVIYKHPPTLLTLPAFYQFVCYTDFIYRIMWAAIFPQKATMIVCLGFFINPSSMCTVHTSPNLLYILMNTKQALASQDYLFNHAGWAEIKFLHRFQGKMSSLLFRGKFRCDCGHICFKYTFFALWWLMTFCTVCSS